MAVVVLDVKGAKCPRPTLEMTIKIKDLKDGDVLEVLANCSTFEADVRKWCERMKKPLLMFKTEADGVMRCQVRK